jgi:hypothetical protein
MNLKRGTFQTVKPPNIYGNSRHLTKDTSYTISYDANIGKNKTIPLPEMPADINYRLIENTLGFQFYNTIKEDSSFYSGFGFGMQNFPYGIATLGFNWKFAEIGSAAFFGLAVDKASYEGEWIEHEYLKLKDIYFLHTYSGAVAYASVYFKKIALSYAASISIPWTMNELPVSNGEYASISFESQALLMQDIGISYMPYKIKYRLGVNQITGVKFPGQYWGLSVQMAYGL